MGDTRYNPVARMRLFCCTRIRLCMGRTIRLSRWAMNQLEDYAYTHDMILMPHADRRGYKFQGFDLVVTDVLPDIDNLAHWPMGHE